VQILDNPAWAALTGPQADLAERHGRSARFRTDISPFAAVDDPADPAAWRDLAALAGPDEEPLLAAPGLTAPPGWTHAGGVPGVQLVGTGVRGVAEPEALVLTPGDMPEILALVERTRPGPFRKRTPELGTYLGIRRAGALVAMAGERMRLPGYTEISAVCTDPAFRGAGLAARLIGAVAAGIQARGDVPFLHTAHDNAAAIRLYERLGFTVRTPIVFAAYRRAVTG
jgi:ribosomal protein S18 acetylase RimI-like enzyme